MAIEKLPINYTDEVVTARQYQVTDVGEYKEVADASVYSSEGSPYTAKDINQTNEAVNEVINLAERNASDLTAIKNGTKNLSAVLADQADRANSATSATNARQSDTITSKTINGVSFDGSSAITIEDDTKVASNDSFLLVSKQKLTFTNKVCTLQDARIKADSLAVVMFTANTLDTATRAVVTAETSNGALTLKAGRTPSGNIYATIYIRSE